MDKPDGQDTGLKHKQIIRIPFYLILSILLIHVNVLFLLAGLASWREVQSSFLPGIRIAMDDVGFGHSCLESLVVLEPHLVKIDQGCVTGLEGHADKIACIERLLKIARSLNMEVIAEGIESPSDLAVLKTLGVESGQGFYWGPPA